MPRVIGFLRKRIMLPQLAARLGFRNRDKINLLIYSFTDFFPETIVRKLPFFSEIKREIKNLLVKGSVGCVNKTEYALVDSWSLFVVSPRHESWIWNYLKPKERDVFIDIGAHVGKYALAVAKAMREGLVVAVEPHPENYQALIKGIELNNLENVVALNIAAWEKDCMLKLFGASSAGRHSVKIDGGLGYVNVEARAMDDVLKQLKVKRVDWVKIDVERAELEVLRGFKQTLREHHPKIIVEVSSGTRGLKNVSDFLKKLYSNVQIVEQEERKDVFLYAD